MYTPARIAKFLLKKQKIDCLEQNIIKFVMLKMLTKMICNQHFIKPNKIHMTVYKGH